MFKLYPSSAFFTVGRYNDSRFESMCYRHIWLGAHGLRAPIPSRSSEMGADYENRVVEEVLDKDSEFTREVPFKIELIPGVQLSGRVDFVSDGQVVEAKSTASATAKKDILELGQYRTYNLAQTVLYMYYLGRPAGTLSYGVYKLNKKTDELEFVGRRDFDVKLSEAGAVTLDGSVTAYTAAAAVAPLVHVAEHLISDQVPDRPLSSLNASFANPCAKCVFSSACNSYETSGDVNMFKVAAAKCIGK